MLQQKNLAQATSTPSYAPGQVLVWHPIKDAQRLHIALEEAKLSLQPDL